MAEQWVAVRRARTVLMARARVRGRRAAEARQLTSVRLECEPHELTVGAVCVCVPRLPSMVCERHREERLGGGGGGGGRREGGRRREEGHAVSP